MVDDGARVVGGAVLVVRLAPLLEDFVEEDDFFDFFFLVFLLRLVIEILNMIRKKEVKKEYDLTSCHPHTGRKLSKNPTSSNRFGYNHKPGGTVKTVAQNNMRRNIAMAKNNPIKPNIPMLRYQTPMRNLTGQSGNMTTAMMITSAPTA